MGRDGGWSLGGEGVRIVPGRERGVHKPRQDLGEFTVPLTAPAALAPSADSRALPAPGRRPPPPRTTTPCCAGCANWARCARRAS
ncbi:hypothetical protein [Streptomyces lydicus]|uniref:hypothetical protein n=1 Tax=Streptomyces lydicus TaxID=47763 RepID=UPI0037A46015